MVVKVGKKDWDINDCTYAERRELHKLNAKYGGMARWMWSPIMKFLKRWEQSPV